MKTLFISIVVLFLSIGLIGGCAEKSKPQEQDAATKTNVQIPPSKRAKSDEKARVFIVEPSGGETVASPVTVKFGAEGITIEPAGEVKDNSGHHHLLVDLAELPPMDQPLPFNDHVLHFGQGQTEASINLTPGEHTLQLLLAGGNHIPHEPPVLSEKMTITVK